jgi:hypothetical protein
MTKFKISMIAAALALASHNADAALLSVFATTVQPSGLAPSASLINQTTRDFKDGELTLTQDDFFKGGAVVYDNKMGLLFDNSATGYGLAITIHLPENVSTISIASNRGLAVKLYDETLHTFREEVNGSNQYVWNIPAMRKDYTPAWPKSALVKTGRLTIAIMSARPGDQFQVTMQDANGNPINEAGEPLNPFIPPATGKTEAVPVPDGAINGYKCFSYKGGDPMYNLKNPPGSSIYRVIDKPLALLKKPAGNDGGDITVESWLDCRAGLVVTQPGQVQVFGWHSDKDVSQGFDVYDTSALRELEKPAMYSPLFMFFAPKAGIYPLSFLVKGNGVTKLYIRTPSDPGFREMKASDTVIRREPGDPGTPSPQVVTPAPAPDEKVSCECPRSAVEAGLSIKVCTCKP